MGAFTYQDQRIAYTEYAARPGGGASRSRQSPPAPADERALILIHGLLLGQDMHMPLAHSLAARGNRVITVDLLGHGHSDRPRDMWRYSMSAFAEQTIALMDHLELEQAAVMGTSLGANTALEMASLAPERLRGLVIEMPVLDNALLACAVVFAPLLVALTFGEPVMRLVQRGALAIPRRWLPFYGNVALDALRQEPGPGAALLQGLFFGRIAPHRTERQTFQTPALVIGHRRDPVHPFSDAGMLASEMPNAELLRANSLVELRLSPERLTEEIAAFLDRIWTSGGSRAGRARGVRTAGGGRAAEGGTRVAASGTPAGAP